MRGMLVGKDFISPFLLHNLYEGRRKGSGTHSSRWRSGRARRCIRSQTAGDQTGAMRRRPRSRRGLSCGVVVGKLDAIKLVGGE